MFSIKAMSHIAGLATAILLLIGACAPVFATYQLTVDPYVPQPPWFVLDFPTVRACATDGGGLSGHRIYFTRTPSYFCGNMMPETVTTDANGYAISRYMGGPAIGTVTITAQDLDRTGQPTATYNAYFYGADMHADSDNDGDIDDPNVDTSDEGAEMTSPGRYVPVNSDDDNSNGTADSSDTSVSAENDLAPVCLEYSAPTGYTVTLIISSPVSNPPMYPPKPIKVWSDETKGTLLVGNAQGDCAVYTVGTDAVPGTVYVEGVYAGTAVLDMIVKDTNGTARTSDQVKFTVVDIRPNITISGLSDEQENSKGEVLVRKTVDNDAIRKMITLNVAGSATWSGSVVLTRNATAASGVKVYTAQTGGTEITFSGGDNSFPKAVLPKQLWVEGSEASDDVRDVELYACLSDRMSLRDDAKFTVIWVTFSCKQNSGTLDSDNWCLWDYGSTQVPTGDPELGYQWLLWGHGDDSQWRGRGSESRGSIAPEEFDPECPSSNSFVYLARTVDGYYWYRESSGGRETVDALTNPADDTSQPMNRDDDPTDGNGRIYDLDAPGMPVYWNDEDDAVHRYRANFTACAKFYDAMSSTYIRCSDYVQWYTRASYQKTGNEDTGTATSGSSTTLSDTGMSWASDGWVPGLVMIRSSEVQRVSTNTSTQLTITPNWLQNPVYGTSYDVQKKLTWEPVNDVSGDNQCGAGTTNLTWNLQ